VLRSHCAAILLVGLRKEKDIEKYDYRLQLKSDTDYKSLFKEISAMESVSNVLFNNRGSIDRV
jgi:hypothetical protein